MNVPNTCPLIDKIQEEIKKHKTTGGKITESYVYVISEHRYEAIHNMLEELRKLNADLRYNATFYKKLYNHFRFGDSDYNPEVLPK